MGDVTKIVSWNVRGLNHPVKRGKIMAHLKSLKADVIFLQETHIRNTARNKLSMGWGSQIYQSNFGARGVANIIKKNVLFDHGCTVRDPDSRFLIVSGTFNCVPVTLINVYGPNFDDPAFFQTILSRIPEVGKTNIIMRGDFNCILDTLMDKQTSRSTTNSKSSDWIKNSTASNAL
uniref:exodeoxyribonuclease III n=1 Tax=Sander lucioperca TaxID=283035 RepID=A0A8C9X622_SANLU